MLTILNLLDCLQDHVYLNARVNQLSLFADNRLSNRRWIKMNRQYTHSWTVQTLATQQSTRWPFLPSASARSCQAGDGLSRWLTKPLPLSYWLLQTSRTVDVSPIARGQAICTFCQGLLSLILVGRSVHIGSAGSKATTNFFIARLSFLGR